MQFNKTAVGKIFYPVPVITVNSITISTVLTLHFGLYEYIDDYSELFIKTILIYFCVITGMIAYFKALLADPGSIPFEFDLLNDSYKEKLPEDEFGHDKRYICASFCQKCQRDRPARTHHCVICGKCIMRMDHHCPWMGNCVGVFNIRYFLQFIIYAMITTSVVSGSCGKLILAGNTSFVINAGYLLTLGLFTMLWGLTVYHLWLASINCNTLELTFYRDKRNFDFGWQENIKNVFGDQVLAYVFPITLRPKYGQGFIFPTKSVNNQGETVYFIEKVLI